MSYKSSVSRGSTRSTASTKSFAESLATLGFGQARDQTFEWLFSYPSAKPLLEAISTSLSPDGVLSPEQATQYRSLRDEASSLPDKILFETAECLAGATSSANIQQLKDAELLAAKERLELLTSQKDILRDAVRQKCRRSKVLRSPKTMRSRLSRLTRHLQEDPDESDAVIKELESTLPLVSFKHSPEQSVDGYVEKEIALGDDLLVEAKHAVRQEEVPQLPSSPLQLSVPDLVKSYGSMKADQCLCEVELVRTNAILAALQLHRFALLEMSNSTMHPLIKDLRSRGRKALQVKCEQTAEKARDLLWPQLHGIIHSETICQRNALIEFMKSIAGICLEQRVRVLCFKLVAGTQVEMYTTLLDSMRHIVPKNVSATEEASTTSNSVGATADEQYTKYESESQAVPAVIRAEEVHVDDGPQTEILESRVFTERLQQLSEILEDFLLTSGYNDSTSSFASHPDYAPLVDEVEQALAHNTSILNSILKKREFHRGAFSSIQNWGRQVNKSR